MKWWFWQYPYPAPAVTWRSLGTAFFLGAFVAMFLYFFQPFGIDRASYADRWLNFAGFGLITTAAYALCFLLLPRLFAPAFTDRRWTVGRQFAYYLLLLLLISAGNGTYINWLLGLELRWDNTLLIIYQTVLLGALPLALLLLFQYSQRLRAALREAEALRILPPGPGTAPEEGGATLLAAEAHGNYVAIWREGEGRRLERATLTATLSGPSGPAVVRCHRSWLVNLRRVTAVRGNAQGLLLTVTGVAPEIPVSRTYIPSVREQLARLACESSQKSAARH